MKHKKNNIYQIVFKSGKQTEFYRKLKSIYDTNSREEIGCKLEWLWQQRITIDNSFENSRVKITLIELKK